MINNYFMNELLDHLHRPSTSSTIAKRLKMKPWFVEKYLEKMVSDGVIFKTNDKTYCSYTSKKCSDDINF